MSALPDHLNLGGTFVHSASVDKKFPEKSDAVLALRRAATREAQPRAGLAVPRRFSYNRGRHAYAPVIATAGPRSPKSPPAVQIRAQEGAARRVSGRHRAAGWIMGKIMPRRRVANCWKKPDSW